MTTDAPPTWVLNRVRRHIAGGRPRRVGDAEVWRFCQDRSDAELLTIDHVGARALQLIRAWSGPPEDTAAQPADPGPPPTTRTPVRLPRLRAVRESRGLSVRQLARASGRPPGAIAVLESLERRAAPSTVRTLARALGVEPDELIGSPDD
jgi:hypothetical protein